MQTIKDQCNQMLNSNITPCFEYEMVNSKYLLVDLQCAENGILFSFDSNDLPVFFDGEIEQVNKDNNNLYILPFDEYMEDLDQYLQMIDQNITEGFLLPNNLYK